MGFTVLGTVGNKPLASSPAPGLERSATTGPGSAGARAAPESRARTAFVQLLCHPMNVPQHTATVRTIWKQSFL